MSSSRLSGYRNKTDEHPGTENYPAGPSDDYRGFGDSDHEPAGYNSKYTPEYKKAGYRGGAGADELPYDPPGSESGSDYDAEYDDWDDWDEPDRRWKWVAAAAGVVLVVAVLVIMLVSGGDDTTTAATTETSAAPRTVIATAPSATTPVVPAPAPSPTAELPPETVTTVTPAPPVAETPAPVEEGAVPPAPSPDTITYTVTGSRQLFDLVSIVYTDEQGLPRTDVNVALPWSRTLVLNPGVTTMSVIATSVSGQLNCTITDAAGGVVVSQENNMMISTCAK